MSGINLDCLIESGKVLFSSHWRVIIWLTILFTASSYSAGLDAHSFSTKSQLYPTDYVVSAPTIIRAGVERIDSDFPMFP